MLEENLDSSQGRRLMTMVGEETDVGLSQQPRCSSRPVVAGAQGQYRPCVGVDCVAKRLLASVGGICGGLFHD